MTEKITQKTLDRKSKEWMKRIEKFNIHKSPIDMDHSALLVIDMQKFFLDSKVPALVDPGNAILPNVKKLIDHYHRKGGQVIYTCHVHRPDGSDLGILEQWWDEHSIEGTDEARIHESIAPKTEDKVIHKHRYSAFYNTDLELTLQSQQIEEVVICGVMTNICCESTARDAFFRDIWVRFVADATASVTEEMHVAALLNLAYAFAEVCLTEDILRGSSQNKQPV
ncbi:MAG: cysteine hydrolase family protein [Thermoplasmata archaeon]